MKKQYWYGVIGLIILAGMFFFFFYDKDTVQSRIDYIKNGGVVPPINMLIKAFESDEELKSQLHADLICRMLYSISGINLEKQSTISIPR
ncbi:MAG TPA: hypothetical protein PLZ29_05605 [Spirochaetota bacterium]|nr:hypothetical protein [Spirochaetota bacterium]